MKILKIDDEFIIADKIISFRVFANPLGSTIIFNLVGKDELPNIYIPESLEDAEAKLIWVLTHYFEFQNYFDWKSYEWKKGE